jgi:hypothetical protein
MASSSGLRVFLLLVASCTHAPAAHPDQPSLSAPAPQAAEAEPAEARPAEAQPVELHPVVTAAVATGSPRTAVTAMDPLSPSPAHHALEWLVDVLVHRKGDVPHDELVEHFDKKLLGPVSTTAAELREWAAAARGAVLESIEVDDPTYIRAYLATQDRRWKVIIEIEPSTSQLTHVSWHLVR